MSSVLCFTVRFLQPCSHGRGEDGSPEWPPSPLRLIQALVAASAGRWNERSVLQHATAAIRWLETLPPPRIIAAPAVSASQPYRLYVPDNVADKVAAAWSRGHDASIADYRTEKDVLPALIDGEAVHYLYALPAASTTWREFVDVLTTAARSITHLGWGIDMVKALDLQKEAVACGYWPLYHYDPRDAQTPFHLDSRAPKGNFREFAMKAARFAILARSKPEEHERLMKLGEEDIRARWPLYEQLAQFQRLPAPGNGNGAKTETSDKATT